MLIYICSRYRADTKLQYEKQLEYTKKMCRDRVLSGHEVIAPHLYYPQFLDDNKEDERELGMLSALQLMDFCDTILVCGKYGISEGMLAEIAYAERHGYRIEEII